MADTPEATFALSASRLCGVAARILGWRIADFWHATPAELAMALDTPIPTAAAPSRAEITRMMERDDG